MSPPFDALTFTYLGHARQIRTTRSNSESAPLGRNLPVVLTMSSSQAPIDLTLDSDDEAGPVQAAAAPSTSKAPMTPYWSPFNDPRPSVPFRRGPDVAAFMPGYKPLTAPPWASNPISMGQSDRTTLPPSASSSQTPDLPGYVPVFAPTRPGEEANDFAVPQAGKRRKISRPPPGLPEQLRGKSVSKEKFYGVKVGHTPGVYTDWETAKRQIVGCKGSLVRRFDTREEAQAYVDGSPDPNPRWAKQPERPYPSPRLDVPPHAAQPSNGVPPVGLRAPPPAKLDESIQPRRELQFERASGTVSSNGAYVSKGLARGRSPSGDIWAIDLDSDGSTSDDHAVGHGKESQTGSGPAIEDPLDTLLDDDIISELLKQLPANDKVAMLMKTHPRGQRVAQAMRPLPNEAVAAARGGRRPLVQVNPAQKLRGRPPLRHVRSSPSASPSDRDRVSSTSDTQTSGNSPETRHPNRDSSTAHRVIATTEQTSSKSWTGALSEREAHLLIYLKEVVGLGWSDITTMFQRHYPNRKYSTLQGIYSTKINRRDRSQDPATLMLPTMYGSEVEIDWTTVHPSSNKPKNLPKRTREVAALQAKPKHQASSAAVNLAQDQPSRAESLARRPRRAMPVQNYTWPKRNAQLGVDSFEEDYMDGVEPAEERLAVSETPETLAAVPAKTIAVNNEPLSMDFDVDDASIALALQKREIGSQPLPYLSLSQRSKLHDVPSGFEWDQLTSRDWQGTLIHVDFSPVELDIAESTIERLIAPQRDLRSRSQRKRLRAFLRRLTEPKCLQLAAALRLRLPSRDRSSIDAFLRDAKEGHIRSTAPRIERLAASRPDKASNSEAERFPSAIVRRRELGRQSNRGWSSATRSVSYQLKNTVQDTLGPVCSYTGASSDVHAVAWSVDGECFAAGAICVDDPHSMQYNRPNNLLYGDVSRNTIIELGKHYVDRPRTDSGPNSSHAMYASQDPKLFKTVTSVAFSPNRKYMFSGGWDKSVWVWETKYDGSQPSNAVSWNHKFEVSMMAVNASGVLATGTKRSAGNAVKVLSLCEDDLMQPPATLNFISDKAAARPDQMILPMALHFSPRYENLLLAGFGANARQDGRDINGDICLWDINGNAQLSIWGSGKNVFDLSFHPRERWMAVATVAGQSANKGMRSSVRVYGEQGGPRGDKFSTLMELECPALDINDVVWW